jgi:uncharacterized membrane protein YphA (DoxX/SURF4 family)
MAETTAADVPTWDIRFKQIALVIARLGLAYLFFTQLFWKLPPTFGCPADYSFTTSTVEEGRIRLQRTSGLCDWIGVEVVWSKQPRELFVADIPNGPRLALNLSAIAGLNGAFLENFVMPNIRWFGWIVWLSELFIVVTLFLGLFSRLGGLVALGVSGQLMIGLAGIPNPYEFEWIYNQMVLLSIVVLGSAPGRYFGVDALLRPRLRQGAAQGNRLAWFAYRFLT